MKLARILILFVLGLTLSVSSVAKIVIAIDAGHGGKDPGAIGKTINVKEKDVTLAIAKELKILLDSNPNFKAVMTRNRDYFVHLPNRTEIARKKRANFLVSIHADSSPSSQNLKGASVWVLSNQRANNELGKWLEDSEKQSELLGGAGSLLANHKERYLNQTVLDLQFSHAQRSGYELGKYILNSLGNVGAIAKQTPQHASLSVLRSPDIPSILIETGFLSNPIEEQKLATVAYRRQLARAIYTGIVNYSNKNKLMSENGRRESNSSNIEQSQEKIASDTKITENKKNSKKELHYNVKNSINIGKSENITKEKARVLENGIHIVQKNETVYSIARLYNTTPDKISQVNKLKNYHIYTGQKLKVK